MNKPSNYYCHKNQFLSTDFDANFEIVQKIGEGAFGQVYKIFDPSSSQLHVIKKNKNQDQKQNISKQNEIMKIMSESQGFVKVKSIFSQSKNLQSLLKNDIKFKQQKEQQKKNFLCAEKCLIMQCLGQSLGNLIQREKVFSVFTTKRIAYKLIQRLWQLHLKMYVHRDIKPDNILLGNQLHPHQIYLVDFGLVTKYRMKPSNIRNIYEGVIGTAKFCPLASHLGNEQFPIDDLQSLGYVLVYFIKGELPWKSSKQLTSQNNKFQEIKKIKESINIDQLSGGISCLRKYFKIIRNINKNEDIPYDKLLQIFQTQSKEQFCFQFCKQKCIQKKKRQKNVQFNQNQQNKEIIQNIQNEQINFQEKVRICKINHYQIKK